MMEPQQVVTGDAASPRRHAVAAAGMVLYCLGLTAAALHAVHIGLPLRLSGLALLASSHIQEYDTQVRMYPVCITHPPGECMSH